MPMGMAGPMSALQWLADSSNQATGGACLALNPWLVRLDAGIGAAAALGLLTAIQFLIDTRAALLHRKTALVIVAVLSGCVALRLAAVLALSSQAHPAEEAAIIATALLFIASAIAFRTLVPFLAPQSRRTAKLELSAFNPPTARQVSQHDPGACLQARNSELEAASNKLARSEVRFRRLIEAGLGATIMINPAGMIERVNAEAERMFGWARQELLGAALEIVIPAQRHQAHAEWCAAFCRSPHERPAAVLIRLSAIKKSGADFPVEVRLTPIETEDGVKILASISDLSASVMAAAELENDRARVQAASHAKSSYLASVSHDLRTPLNGILGYAQLLRMEAKLPARQTEYVEAMVEAGHHLLATINNVLDLNEIESQHLALRPATFALRPALTECVSLIQPAAAAKGLTVRLEIAEDTPAGVLGDRVRLQQILINLLGNAAKFTSAGSITMRVTACPRGQDDMFRFAVADTGPGIPTNQAERVFERFERLDTHVADAVEGSGLGLTLSSQVAALMGGSLRYEDNPGGGSLFLLEIPLGLSALPAGQKPATRLRRHDNKRHASARILVVDDTAMNRDVACRFLAASGYDPIVAVGGEDAVRVAKDEDLAAILMDVVMPEVDGIEATSRIRALAGPRGSVPIIGLTANAFVQQVQTCLQAGMDDHLAKPYHFPDLLAKIRRAVDLGAHRRRDVVVRRCGLAVWRLPAATAPISRLAGYRARSGGPDSRRAFHGRACTARASNGRVCNGRVCKDCIYTD